MPEDELGAGADCIVDPSGPGPRIWFQVVPEPKTAKNRIHLDLRAPGPLPDEVTRLTKLGATVLRIGKDLTVMADPEGNEFCVE